MQVPRGEFAMLDTGLDGSCAVCSLKSVLVKVGLQGVVVQIQEGLNFHVQEG